ncbi:unnamed protein product [Darwinula stevensoni]|uniref:Alpha-tubulin N-acetyltransferase n=1 Tax=Darwinula stevensoni TaxID=69355 RepID=A0A7R9A4T3_9CRUS|nr:unnamed protein product [Darwinula stevensoni]CAG0884019.1 unnamed protein product [Darwinula stevensoni]
MEFQFSVGPLFKHSLCKLNNYLDIESVTSDGGEREVTRTDRRMVNPLSEVINRMGEASAKAQRLNVPITTFEKLQNSDNHHVYLIVDRDFKNGKGAVVGLLKVGHKNLFIIDEAGAQNEVSPLCILDFYVHESRQRLGFGKHIFDFMLQEEKVKPAHLAIDKPSEKLLHFLRKHYGLAHVIPQANNFVVFQGFFTNRPDAVNRNTRDRLYLESNSPGITRKADSLSKDRYVPSEVVPLNEASVKPNLCAPGPKTNIHMIFQGEQSEDILTSYRTSSLTETFSKPQPGTAAFRRDLKFSHKPLW